MSILIQNGTLILPDGPFQGDLRIIDGKIAQIGSQLPIDGATVINAQDRLVFPGFIDTHTHFEMNKGLPNETADDFASGTLAALIGGTTTILDFATQDRGMTLTQALDTWHQRADGHCACNYGFHMAITDWNDAVAAELPKMTAAGVTSYKLYMAYDALRVSDETALAVVKAVKAEGGIVGCHCEDGDMVTAGIAAQKSLGHTAPWAHPLSRPPQVEVVAIRRWLAIGAQAETPVNVVHLSTLEGMTAIRNARQNGQAVYVESCPQYFLLDDSAFDCPGFEGAKFVFSPPLRKEGDRTALWDALANGEIDTIGTDHCSFHFNGAKQLGKDDFSAIPNGIPGAEHRPSLMYTYGVVGGHITPLDLARYLAEQPAKLFGMYPKKGVLQVGSDGDVVIINQNSTNSIRSSTQIQAVDYTPYEGMPLSCTVETVLLDGQVVVKSGQLLSAISGQYVPRGPSVFWR